MEFEISFMKRAKVFLLISAICFSTTLFSQVSEFRNDNVLLPEKLIFSEHIGFDSLYLYTIDSMRNDRLAKPFFDVHKYLDFTRIIAEKAMSATIRVSDASQYDERYPYSALKSGKPLSAIEVLKNLGQDTFRMLDSLGAEERLIVKEIDFGELNSLNFIEDWTLRLDPLCFRKNVYAIEPIRRYSGSWADDTIDYRYRRVFRFYNNQDKKTDSSNLKLIANVKYEHFFNLDRAYQGQNFQKLVDMNFLQNEKDFETNQITNNINSPFFNIFNQRIFIKTLLDNVFSGKAQATDFKSSKVLTPTEAKSRVFEMVTVKVINPDTWTEEERTVENDYTSEIVSVIFIEDWYFDEESLRFEKKVVGIAPVRYYYDRVNEQDILKREILFTVNL